MSSKMTDVERAAAIEGIKTAWAHAGVVVSGDELSSTDFESILELERRTAGEKVRRRALLNEDASNAYTQPSVGEAEDELKEEMQVLDADEVREVLLLELFELDAVDVALELIQLLPATDDLERTSVQSCQRALTSILIERKEFERAMEFATRFFEESTHDYVGVVVEVYDADRTLARLDEARRQIAERILLGNALGRSPNEGCRAWIALWYKSRDAQDLEMAYAAASLLPPNRKAFAYYDLAQATADANDFLMAFRLFQELYDRAPTNRARSEVLDTVAQLCEVLKCKLSNAVMQGEQGCPEDIVTLTPVTLDRARWLREQLVTINPRWADLVQKLIDRARLISGVLGRGTVTSIKQ